MIDFERNLQELSESSIEVFDEYDEEEEKMNKNDAKMISERYKEKGKDFKFILNFAGIKDEIVSLFLEKISIVNEKYSDDVREVENDEIVKLRMACRNIIDVHEEFLSLASDEIKKIYTRFEVIEKNSKKTLNSSKN